MDSFVKDHVFIGETFIVNVCSASGLNVFRAFEQDVAYSFEGVDPSLSVSSLSSQNSQCGVRE